MLAPLWPRSVMNEHDSGEHAQQNPSRRPVIVLLPLWCFFTVRPLPKVMRLLMGFDHIRNRTVVMLSMGSIPSRQHRCYTDTSIKWDRTHLKSEQIFRLEVSGPLPLLHIQQRGVQWKQGVVIYMKLSTSLYYDTTPIHCTPLRLHPPLINTQLLHPLRCGPGCGADPLDQEEDLPPT